jgi:hypothetical protein
MGSVREASDRTGKAADEIGDKVKAGHEGVDRLARAMVDMREDMRKVEEAAQSGGFRLAADFPKLMVQHLLWVIKARLALDGLLPAEARSLGDHGKCDLGKWMRSDAAEWVRKKPSFQELEASHRLLHSKANDILAGSADTSVEENELQFAQLLETSRGILGHLATMHEQALEAQT